MVIYKGKLRGLTYKEIQLSMLFGRLVEEIKPEDFGVN